MDKYNREKLDATQTILLQLVFGIIFHTGVAECTPPYHQQGEKKQCGGKSYIENIVEGLVDISCTQR